MGSLRFNVSLGLYFCIDNPSHLALAQLLLAPSRSFQALKPMELVGSVKEEGA